MPAKTLSDFLRLGNDTFDFKLYHTPVQNPSGQDITLHVLENGYGQCKDYNSAFVTMARIAGLPARYVAGYVGGEWNGNGYTVSTVHQSSWGEVRLELDTGSSIIDLGWIPFDSCPAAEEVEIVKENVEFKLPKELRVN